MLDSAETKYKLRWSSGGNRNAALLENRTRPQSGEVARAYLHNHRDNHVLEEYLSQISD